MEIIKTENLTKNYIKQNKNIPVLYGISLTVQNGDFLSIVGPSGSGKSTLMNILGFLDPPSGGEYRFCGEISKKLGERKLTDIRRKNIGFIFQSFNLIPSLNMLENVELPMIYKGVSKKERREKAKAAIEKVGLYERMTHYPSELSGGQCQRVAIARAIADAPQIILADEPTGNLDVASGRQITDILFKLNGEGKTIILITHDNLLAAKTPRKIEIRDGKIV
ncbi:MAG: ABC transporter ATP-binding protein [Oscillospiraceae bacterium]|nr:ABC transporter ATP-binding protein [Candidatus Equicaccousia limihippi]